MECHQSEEQRKSRMKVKATPWKKIFTNCASENGLISKYIRNNNQKLKWREKNNLMSSQ